MVEFNKYGFKQIVSDERSECPNDGLWQSEYGKVFIRVRGNVCNIAHLHPFFDIFDRLIIRENKDLAFFLNHIVLLKETLLIQPCILEKNGGNPYNEPSLLE